MQYHKIILPLCIIIGVTACNNSNSNNNSTAIHTDSAAMPNEKLLPPVETQKPNSNYTPAFEGQTRIPAVKTVTAYQVDKIAGKIGEPWAIIPYSNDRFLITDKSGFMQIISADGAVLKKITGFPEVDNRAQGGLLDVALDPDFTQNKTIYWAFSEKQKNDGNLTAIAKGIINEVEDKIEKVSVIFRVLPALNSTLHYGSRLVFDKEGYLYFSAGERSILEGRKQAQYLKSGLGKIFKITKEGKPAPGNPFANNSSAMASIYTYGHRNPQSLDINPATGELWEAEFGPRGGDELNLITAGKNYGWPVITYGIEYYGAIIGDAIQQKEGMEQPVYYWDPVISPSGMTFYPGNEIPEWENNLFIGGLSSQQITRLQLQNHKVTGEERLLTNLNERFRDIAFFKGMLYTITDNGNVYRIKKKS